VFVTPLLAERRVDGAILIDPVPGDSFVDAVVALDMPAVSLGRVEGHPEMLSVDHDHAMAMRGAVEHLELQGYERPAMLSLAAEMSYVADMDAAFERFAPPGAPVLSATEFSERSGYELAQELLEAPDPPDAIFCVNDILAAGAAHAAADLGVLVPDELGIVGVGDSVRAREAAVPLTSVRVFPERAGALLLELIEAALATGEQPAPPEPLPTELVVRQSTTRR
jgi:DNA-binding LacI/PurR family transcriptional regulator